jgi:hypothetical protein
MRLIGGPWNPSQHFGAGGHLGSVTGALPSCVSTWITQTRIDGLFWLSEFSTTNSCLRI